MASWKKYFTAVPGPARLQQRYDNAQREGGASSGTSSKYNSYLPEVYSGAPNRVERYIQYEQMDLDSEISRALDTISDFATQTYEQGDEPFQITFKQTPSETEVKLLKTTLSQWCSLNKFQQRLWRAFRNTIKYGDQIYIRDPETFRLIWIDPTKVEKIIVNESKGKEVEQYVIRDLDINLTTLVGTSMLVHDQYSFPGGYPRSSNPAAGAGTVNYGVSSSPGSRSSRFNMPENQFAVDASHVVHLSISEGMDSQWPFGTSILESVYKVYKQKDLLEDSIIIYRIVRAPERRVFYIDVGSLSGPRAQQYVERIKNEIYQRRIPNRTGGGTCLDLNTAVPLIDGRTLSISNLIEEYNTGKQNWAYSCDPISGEIVPGPITWAGVTRKNTQVISITLDNGEKIVCTPDHKIPIVEKGKVEAKDIVIGVDRLISFKRTALHFNHTVVNIEWLDKLQDTGTITIDGDEKYHSHHTFAIEQDVFVYNSVIDASYNPISINEDYFLAQNAEGKGTRIETLNAGENLGQIDDLRYFNNKLMRGLGIPSSYLPTGADDGTTAYSDGKTGTAYIQEYRFSKYCERLQNLLIPILDKEFKIFLKNRGIDISSNQFELQFWPPQSFSKYRQMSIDTDQINVFSSIMSTEAAKYISKRFALKRYAGWTDEEILENEEMWAQENAKRVKGVTGNDPMDASAPGLAGVGIKASIPDEFGGIREPEPEEEPAGGEDAGIAGDTSNAVSPAAPPGGTTATTTLPSL